MKFALSIYLLSSFFIHDIQVAFFSLSENGKKITLEIKLELEDIESTFKELGMELSDAMIAKYMVEHLSLSLNDKHQDLTFTNFKIKNKHLILLSEIPRGDESIHSVELRNTCLLNIDNHSNIIQVRLNNKMRDFLMNRRRTFIDIEY